MTNATLYELLSSAIENAEENSIQPEQAIKPELIGKRIYDLPILGCADAKDPLFIKMKSDKKIYGPMLRLPDEWLPGAKSVISFFLPYSQAVRDSNREHPEIPSPLWLHARVEGQDFLMNLCKLLASAIEREGFRAVIPSCSSEFAKNFDAERLNRGEPGYTSNWSERHAAFAAGLGTFSLSKHLITEKGVCGRFGSIITDAPLEPLARSYTDPYEYCTFCGACIPRCPAASISLENGKDVVSCAEFVNRTRIEFAPRYGCGKCQLDVPCEFKRP